MAIIKIVESGKTKASLITALNYIHDENKITLKNGKKLSTALNCWGSLKDIYNTMIETKEIYRKAIDNKNSEMYKHFQQAFKPNEVLPELAHKIGVEWAKENFAKEGFEILICTHLDKEHIHNHFIINSVNPLTGKTIKINANKTLEKLKTSSDELCKAHNLSVIDRTAKRKNRNYYTKEKIIYNMNKRYSVTNEKFQKSSWQKNFDEIITATMEIAKGKGFDFFAKELLKNEISIQYKRLKNDIIFKHIKSDKAISNLNLQETFKNYHQENYLLRKTIEKIVGDFPEYELSIDEILSKRKQHFYKLIGNLIDSIDNARIAKIKEEFYQLMENQGWQIKDSFTGRAFYNVENKRFFYDNTIYKIVGKENYCLAKIEKSLK